MKALLAALLLVPVTQFHAADVAPQPLATPASSEPGPLSRASRIETVRGTPGLVAFSDFVNREAGPQGAGNFLAHTAQGDNHRYVLEPRNISRDFWHEGADTPGVKEPGPVLRPPETVSVREEVVSESLTERIVLRTYEFTKVRVTLRKDSAGRFSEVAPAELVSLKANPYWFGHDIYAPRTPAEGGPFTIGRVIHSNRHPTLSARFGGVAVFDRALAGPEMGRLCAIGRGQPIPAPDPLGFRRRESRDLSFSRQSHSPEQSEGAL